MRFRISSSTEVRPANANGKNSDYVEVQNRWLRRLTRIRSFPLVLALILVFFVVAGLGLAAF